MMFCRAAWQRLAPLARKTLTPLSSNALVPIRQMSFGLPASGTNIAYMVLGGSSLTAALLYAYKTVNTDSGRNNERITQIEAKTKRPVAEVAVVAEAAPVVETSAPEQITIVEATAVETIVEAVKAEAEETSAEYVEAEMEAEAVTVQAVVVDAEEPAALVVEDVAAEAPIAETTVTPMSDLMSTVKILAGSTVEIAAASVGDQHLVSAVRLAEENNAAEIFNGLETVDMKAEVSVPEEAGVEEVSTDRSDLKTEELVDSGFLSEEDTAVEVADDHVNSDADGSFVVESHTFLEGTEIENTAELVESTNPVGMLTEDDTMSRGSEAQLETVVAVGEIIDEDKGLCHDPAGTKMEYADFETPPGDLEETLQTSAVVTETMLDSVEETKPASEASEEVVESGNVAMTMPQA